MPQDKYTPEEKQFMLSLARDTLESYIRYNKIPKIDLDKLSDSLKSPGPCFVTLNKKNYGLRGCIGMFSFDTPLYKNIISRTIAAATQDYRFPVVRAEELKDIKVEVSILTEPQPLQFKDPDDLLNNLQVFVDGVILYTSYGSSTYLPQVWEQLPDKEQFLTHLCQKHGAPGDFWKTNYKQLRVETYQAIHFEEETYGNKTQGQ
ncbi:MAG: AmmeMemoRadiSam system protein A [Candidatus Omnitrophota bacterium]